MESFGIDWLLVAAQIINFLVILFVLRRFLYKPLFKLFKQREELAQQTNKNAEESKKVLEKTQAEEKDILKKAQTTATQIIKDAKDQTTEIMQKSEEATRKQTEQMIAEAREQIALETKAAEQQLNKYVSKLSVELLKKSLSNVFTDKEQSTIVNKAVKQLQKESN